MVNIMMGLDINLDYQSRIPIYEQIVNNIEKYVAVGILREKSQIPSIRELANNLGINPNTVKKAYDILENRGVIMTISTKGTFISNNTKMVLENKIDNEINLIKDKIRELENMGISKKEIMKRIEK
ncbi:MAG: GntR family transcriptional regulator [Bacilli bacterium]|jgi:GntR family transcriptional regulator|nr:GntR family transcriptional regulator [Bacilli bacterium]